MEYITITFIVIFFKKKEKIKGLQPCWGILFLLCFGIPHTIRSIIYFQNFRNCDQTIEVFWKILNIFFGIIPKNTDSIASFLKLTTIYFFISFFIGNLVSHQVSRFLFGWNWCPFKLHRYYWNGKIIEIFEACIRGGTIKKRTYIFTILSVQTCV